MPIPMTKKRTSFLAVIAATAALASACSHADLSGSPKATAKLEPTQGNTASGTITFQEQGAQTVLVAKVSGLTPNQSHGFHVHEKGDCSSPDGNSAGSHFNPHNHRHGPLDDEHHAGDLPLLSADASGRAELRVVLQDVTVRPGANSVVGRGVIVHASPDDFKTQPTGGSGARIACGVILKN